MRFYSSLCLLFLSLVIWISIEGCNKTTTDLGNLYVPTANDVTPTATLQELEQGRALYIDNCNTCHGLYAPESFIPADWKNILNIMTPKTNMSTSDVQLVTKYVCKGKQ